MRRLTSTLALVLVFAGLMGYIYFIDSKAPDGGEEAKQRAFPSLSADDIEEVRIAASAGETTRLTKADGAWKIVEPVDAEADAGELSSITGSLATLDIQRVVDEQATDLKPYGLDPVRVDVTFKVKGQPGERRILFGDRTATGADLYATLPDSPRVFLVSSFLDSTFNKNTFALRDKAVLKVDRQKADGFELTSGSTHLAFAKSGDAWTMTAPLKARADYAAVEGAIERLSSAQMQGLAVDQSAPARTFGLDAPSATLTIRTGSSSATLSLGKTENAVTYARDAARPAVFTVAPTLRADLFKDAAEYRRKDLFDVRSFTANHVEFTRGGETRVFERAKTQDGKEAWNDGAGKSVDAMKVEDLLTKVSGLRAASFDTAANPALKSPVLTVVARFDKGSDTVVFGRTGADVVASRSDEPGVAHVEAQPFDEVLEALDALK